MGRFRPLDGRWITCVEPGTPDWICVHPRHPAFYLETKAPGGSSSPAQVWMHRFLTAGWRLQVAVIDDVAGLAVWLRSHEEPTL